MSIFFLQVKTKRQRKRESKATSREIIEDKDDSSGGEIPLETTSTQSQDSFSHKDSKLDENDEDKRKSKKKESQRKKKKNESGPMHFTANSEPRALDVLGDLEPSIFNEVSILFFIMHIINLIEMQMMRGRVSE